MPVGIAVRRTDSADGSRVGAPAKTELSEERETRALDMEANPLISEGELPTSVGELPTSVVVAACGIGSASARAARPRSTALLRNILA